MNADALFRRGLLGMMVLSCSYAGQVGTICVNQNNVPGVTNGPTLATDWITIADGLAHLAAVNAGTETTDIDLDFYRSRRLVGPAVDIGIYELPPAGSVLCFW